MTTAERSYESLVAGLDVRGESRERREAVRLLREAGESAKPALLRGLSHPAWRVRHGCLRVLDHTIIDDPTRRHIIDSLADPHRKVRQAAIHALGCEVCKPEGFCGVEGVDLVGMYLQVIQTDPSLRVRRAAMGRFMWTAEQPEERVQAVLESLLADAPDASLRERAASALAWSAAFASQPERKAGLARYREIVTALLAA